MSHDDFTLKWVCKVCKQKAEYNAMGTFLCRKHWEEYLKLPQVYLKNLKKRKKS